MTQILTETTPAVALGKVRTWHQKLRKQQVLLLSQCRCSCKGGRGPIPSAVSDDVHPEDGPRVAGAGGHFGRERHPRVRGPDEAVRGGLPLEDVEGPLRARVHGLPHKEVEAN